MFFVDCIHRSHNFHYYCYWQHPPMQTPKMEKKKENGKFNMKFFFNVTWGKVMPIGLAKPVYEQTKWNPIYRQRLYFILFGDRASFQTTLSSSHHNRLTQNSFHLMDFQFIVRNTDSILCTKWMKFIKFPHILQHRFNECTFSVEMDFMSLWKIIYRLGNWMRAYKNH